MSRKKDFAAMESRRPSASSRSAAAHDALRSRMATPTRVPLSDVQANPRNPRYDDDDPELMELAESMRRVGQLQPALIASLDEYLRVYPDREGLLNDAPWVVIIGNRRRAAAVLAEQPHFDVRVIEDIKSAEDLDDRILIENIHRKDLPPLLEASQLQRRLEREGETLRSVGAAIGKSHTYVKQRVVLLQLLPEFQALLRDGGLNTKQARELGGLPENEQRMRLAGGPPFAKMAATPRAEPQAQGQASESEAATEQGAGSEAVQEAGETRGSGVGNPVSNNDHATTGCAASDEGLSDPAEQPAPQSSSPPGDTLESTMLTVMSMVEAALSSLDGAIPDGGDGDLGHRLAEGRRHLQAAKRAIEGQRDFAAS
ncbi:ParB/RepB/Spo0J family partition protein [Pseudonocardia xishanensis]|uniref:ParB-like N-terminal domain-containing protein n=1 Tax=Pseudonocardia xishanensis TaxID=630995 RepID=A0ABP8S0B5_9PSEU